MPFSKIENISKKKLDEIYEFLFKPAIEKSGLGYVCERSRIRNGAFTRDILVNLQNSEVVLADLTGFNPNVMWELGIRHTLSNRTILVSKESRKYKKIISDIGIYGVVFYRPDLRGKDQFNKEIKKILDDIEKEPERSDNPVYDFLKQEDIILMSFERKIVINKMIGLLSELFSNLKFAEIMIKGGKYITLRKYHTDAIRHLLTTNYISTAPEYLALMKDLVIVAENANTELDYLIFVNRNHKASKKLVLNLSKDMKKEVEHAIKWTEHLIFHIKQGDPVFSQSPIMVMNKEHRKLLTGSDYVGLALD